MKDIWFDEDDNCLACGDILTRASLIQGLCSDCVATEGRDEENTNLFSTWGADDEDEWTVAEWVEENDSTING